jgi:hypothetical protein
MSDYTPSGYELLSVALDLGGVLRRVTPCPPADAGGRIADSPLSKVHIGPFIEYRAGASLLRTCKGGKTEPPQGGPRGQITGFSDASRRRLLRVIAGVRRDAQLPLFITLTYPEIFPEPSTSKRHLKTFFKRLFRAFPDCGLIWKLEPQDRGAPHYHILAWGPELADMLNFVPFAWHEIAGGEDPKHLRWHMGLLGNGNVPCVSEVQSFRGVWSYASKYLGKTFEVAGWSKKWTGRYWGVLQKERIPFGELIQTEVTYKQAVNVQRYQRRFANLKRANRSVVTYCDASQWVQKLELDP